MTVADSFKAVTSLLNNNPIFYRGKNFYLMWFGVYTGIGSFFGFSLLAYTLYAKNIPLAYPPEYWIAVIVLLMILFSKFLHPLVIGKDFFKQSKTYIKQTAFYNQGGQVGVFVGIALMCYVEQINFFVLWDLTLYAYCFALIISRIGCYNYGCCFGKATNSKWSINYQHPDAKILRLYPDLANIQIIPTQLCEVLFNIVLFILMTIALKLDIRTGITGCLGMIAYNFFRIYMHQFRANDTSKNTNATNDNNIFYWAAALLTLLGITLLIINLLLGDHIPNYPFHSFTFFSYFDYVFLQPYHFFSAFLIGLFTLFVYGYHHKKIGQHY